MATVDFLDEKRREIADRLTELEPVVDEYARLEAAVAALDGMRTPAARSGQTRRASAAPAPVPMPARTREAPLRPRGRPKGSGKRRLEALELIRANPGITIAEIAQRMGIKQNYLYRVLPGLVEGGLVVRDGRGWKPMAAA